MTRVCFLFMVLAVFRLDYLVHSEVTYGWTTTPRRPCNISPAPAPCAGPNCTWGPTSFHVFRPVAAATRGRVRRRVVVAAGARVHVLLHRARLVPLAPGGGEDNSPVTTETVEELANLPFVGRVMESSQDRILSITLCQTPGAEARGHPSVFAGCHIGNRHIT